MALQKRCGYCDQKFKSLDALHAHLEETRKHTTYICCEQLFSSSSTYNAHVKTHGKAKPPTSTVNTAPASISVNSTDPKVPLPATKSTASTSKEVKTLASSKSPSAKKPALVNRKEVASVDIKVLLNDKERNFKDSAWLALSEKGKCCPYCQRKFKNPAALHEHLIKFTKHEVYICCKSLFPNASALKLHKESHTLASNLPSNKPSTQQKTSSNSVCTPTSSSISKSDIAKPNLPKPTLSTSNNTSTKQQVPTDSKPAAIETHVCCGRIFSTSAAKNEHIQNSRRHQATLKQDLHIRSEPHKASSSASANTSVKQQVAISFHPHVSEVYYCCGRTFSTLEAKREHIKTSCYYQTPLEKKPCPYEPGTIEYEYYKPTSFTSNDTSTKQQVPTDSKPAAIETHVCCGRIFSTSAAKNEHIQNSRRHQSTLKQDLHIRSEPHKASSSASANTSVKQQVAISFHPHVSEVYYCCGRTFSTLEAKREHIKTSCYYQTPLEKKPCPYEPGTIEYEYYKPTSFTSNDTSTKQQVPTNSKPAAIETHVCCGRIFNTSAAKNEHIQNSRRHQSTLKQDLHIRSEPHKASSSALADTSAKQSMSINLQALAFKPYYCCGRTFNTLVAKREHILTSCYYDTIMIQKLPACEQQILKDLLKSDDIVNSITSPLAFSAPKATKSGWSDGMRFVFFSIFLASIFIWIKK
ncbi:hypothetical protein BDF19DRAFT_420265 [Syncephalis fuscata]|nr:hypothetical protein BDF19DRAFT_420265 [Syncephalis fuscata]